MGNTRHFQEDGFAGTDVKWADRQNYERTRIEWTGDDPPEEGDLFVTRGGAVKSVDGTGSTWTDGGETHRYVYLEDSDVEIEDVDDGDLPPLVRDEVKTVRVGSPRDGVTAFRHDGEWVAPVENADGWWSCNECGGTLASKDDRCRCGVRPSSGIGVTFHQPVRPASDSEIRDVKSNRQKATLREVGRAAVRNHRIAVHESKVERVESLDHLHKTDSSPRSRALPDVEESEVVSEVNKSRSGRTSRVHRLVWVELDTGEEAFKRSFGNRVVWYLPHHVREEAVMVRAESLGWTPEMCREWLEDYEGCVGTEDRRFVAELDGGSTRSKRLKAAHVVESDRNRIRDFVLRVCDGEVVEVDPDELNGVKEFPSGEWIGRSGDSVVLNVSCLATTRFDRHGEGVDRLLEEVRCYKRSLENLERFGGVTVREGGA